MNVLEFRLQSRNSQAMRLAAKALTIAGWTGRNPAAVQRHIDELKILGVSPPKQIPTLYRVARNLLTTDSVIETVGKNASGEAEFCIFNFNGHLYVAVGSDHTDRALEAHDVALAKQVCAKPMSRDCWFFDEVESHWDQLILRSFATKGGVRRLYQEGPVSGLLHPRELFLKIASPFDHGHVLFGGTVPVEGLVSGADAFRVELHDPVLNRTLVCEYETIVL